MQQQHERIAILVSRHLETLRAEKGKEAAIIDAADVLGEAIYCIYAHGGRQRVMNAVGRILDLWDDLLDNP